MTKIIIFSILLTLFGWVGYCGLGREAAYYRTEARV